MGKAKSTTNISMRRTTHSATKTVSFRLNAPSATSIALVGDFNDWDPNARKMRRNKSGGWWVTIRLAPGVYQYKFVIDSIEWREDPENPRRELNSYGTMNSVCEVA